MPRLKKKTSNFSADNEFETPMEYHEAVYEELVQNIENAFEKGLIDEDEANEALVQADVDLAIRALIEEGWDEEEATEAVYSELEEVLSEQDDELEYEDEAEEDLDEVYYSHKNSGTAEFNEELGNDFAAAIYELITEEYEDVEAGIMTLAQASGYDPEDIAGLLTGEYVADEAMVDTIAQCFDSTMQEEEMYIALHLLAAEARGEDIEDEGYMPEEDQEEEYDPEMEAAYSQINQLEGKIADFQAQSDLKNELDRLIRLGMDLMENQQKLSPVQFAGLFGDLPDALDNEKVALFSSVCDANQVDVPTELYAMQKCLEFASRCGQILPSGEIVNSDFSLDDGAEEEAEFNAQVDDAVKRNLSMYQSQGFLKADTL